MHTPRHHLALALLAGLLTGLPAALPAQTVTDPTRPPISAPAELAERSTEAAARVPRAPAAPASAPQLQSIQLPRQGAPSALVDGRIVRVGERIGDQTVASIDAHGVLLRSARGPSLTLSLLTGVLKTPSLAAPEIAHTFAAGTRKPAP